MILLAEAALVIGLVGALLIFELLPLYRQKWREEREQKQRDEAPPPG